ncbi:hypothetical protein COCNU_contig69338813G000020 [Cocos nucifera]|nr:hypothetical protein [Cocos nucifera]
MRRKASEIREMMAGALKGDGELKGSSFKAMENFLETAFSTRINDLKFSPWFEIYSEWSDHSFGCIIIVNQFGTFTTDLWRWLAGLRYHEMRHMMKQREW